MYLGRIKDKTSELGIFVRSTSGHA